MIKAINAQGTITYFKDKVWELMSKDVGWKEYKDKGLIEVPEQIIEYQKSFKPKSIQKELSLEEMKDFLRNKGITFHQKLGYSKIKLLYDDNSK